MKYLKKRVSRKHKKSCRKTYRKASKCRIKSKRCKTVRRRHVMRGGWGLNLTSSPSSSEEEEEKSSMFIGGSCWHR